MKTPWYETSAGAMVALLVSRNFVKADLYTITLKGGGILRFCTGDLDISVPGFFTWVSNTVPVGVLGGSNTRAHYKVGTDVDVWQFPLAVRPVSISGTPYPDLIGNVPWLQAVRSGLLDGATIKVDRAIFTAWPTGSIPASISPVGVVTIFYGYVAAIDFDRAAILISIQSLLQLLTKQLPYRVIQSGCRNTLFDVGCTLSPASFVTATSCASGSTQNALKSSVTPPGSGTFRLGRITMTSGQNSGFSRAIRDWGNPNFTLMVPLPFPVTIGDTFNVYPGCDKTIATCTLFSNLANFSGEPYVPAAETAI